MLPGFLQLIGCIGALRLSEKLLNAYWSLLLVLLIGDAILGIFWMFKFDKIMQDIPMLLRYVVNNTIIDNIKLYKNYNIIQITIYEWIWIFGWISSIMGTITIRREMLWSFWSSSKNLKSINKWIRNIFFSIIIGLWFQSNIPSIMLHNWYRKTTTTCLASYVSTSRRNDIE